MNDGGIPGEDAIALPSSFRNDISLNIVDTPTMAVNANIRPQPRLSAEPIGRNFTAIRSFGADEDDSSRSSSATDLFDRESKDSSLRSSRRDDDWQRYGSSVSATSTTISSICSSIAAEDKRLEHVQTFTLSKKRMSDGTFKESPILSNPPLDAAVSENVKPTAYYKSMTDSPQQTATAQQPPPKRRGRPPKDKPASEVSSGSGTKVRRASDISKLQNEVRPRSSIPSRLPADIYAGECIEAARASRLDPFGLHAGEHQLLLDLLMSKEVTVYLNIRNAILRLWHQNPLCSVTPQEAAGCAKEGRFYGLAEVAYKWLVRNGYVNFGCIEVPRDPISFRQSRKTANQKTVVVVGAGVSGLATARQLEALFAQSSEKWTEKGERPPRVIVLEGRRRIGGRVYSKPLRSQIPGTLPDDLRNTAEMGAMIVTGFEHGNPLNIVIRGQLGLRYHLMKDALTIYDCDGKAVDEERDMLNTELYADISDRAGEFRAKPYNIHTLKGDEELISRCRDPVPDGFASFQLEPLFDLNDNLKKHKPAARRGRRRNAPPGTEKITGRSRVVEDSNATQSAARAAKSMGWQLREGVAKNQSITLHKQANASIYPALGTIMDEAIEQYKDLIDITPQDMRLLNWHHANLEYANAAPVSSLSLSGHDQDTGNEFEGAHSEIIGGYTQLPRGLMNLPTKLDVRFDCAVESIHYDGNGEGQYSTKVVCTDGEVVQADEVVLTTPLGVLKTDMIDFDPPLPRWKQGAIDRMGFGLLNKVILLYEKPFWDDSRDMFGLLNEAERAASLDPTDHARRRGRFYLIWNASKTSGRPMLVALMAGHAAHDVETTDSNALLAEINTRLCTVFHSTPVPPPIEVIVTRWKRDPFTRGTYSYVAPETRPGDYDLMSYPVGNLHFAGEATCGTHPATVHGAFLSGLRVAAEVMEAMTGPVSVPIPLVEQPAAAKQSILAQKPTIQHLDTYAGTANLAQTSAYTSAGATRQEDDSIPSTNASPSDTPISVAKRRIPTGPPRHSVCPGDPSFWVQPSLLTGPTDLGREATIIAATLSQIGDRPAKPPRPGVNPFLLYAKDKWEECKAFLAANDAPSASASPRPGVKAESTGAGGGNGRDLIRTALGKWWRAASEETKEPYVLQSQRAQEAADMARKEWESASARWDQEAKRIRKEYEQENPLRITAADGSTKTDTAAVTMGGGVGGASMGVSRRKTNVSNCVVLDGSCM